MRKISGINGEVPLKQPLKLHSEKLDNLVEEGSEEEEDGEEIKKIAGTKIQNNNNDDLILHLVSTSLSNIHEK